MKLLTLLLTPLTFIACSSERPPDQKADYFRNLGTQETTVTDSAQKSTPVHVHDSSATVHYGLDISHYQGNLLSELKVNDNVTFIICKATQGSKHVDPDFRTNWRETRTKGFVRGAYHFYMCTEDPMAQANHFSTAIEDLEHTDIAPVLDIEQGGMSSTISREQMQADILTFLRQVEKNTGRKPILYTDYAFANQYLTHSGFAQYDLWLAEYTGKANPKVPSVWKQRGFKIWQKSERYKIDSETADLDVFYGSLTDLVK